MKSIENAFSNYFHLIRHPREAERKRDKLLTAIAILFCVTVVVPAVMGIGYALAGRVKQRAEGFVPVGFKNYGNSCWFTSAVQVLLASRHFEQIVNQPLALRKNIEVFDRDENGDMRRGWITRDETQDEFTTRLEIQRALLKFLDAIKIESPKQMQSEMVDFHKEMLKIVPQYFEIGKKGFSAVLFDIIENVFEEGFLYFPNDLLLEQEHEEPFSQVAINPKILFVPINDSVKGFSLDKVHDLSQHNIEGVFKLVGIRRKYSKQHATAFVLRNEQWFHCNDGAVKALQANVVDLKSGDILLFDLTSSG